MEATNRMYATGRRKHASARVYLTPGNGKITINKRTIEDFFPREVLRMVISQPFELTNTVNRFDLLVNVNGGGLTGQAEAIKHGISRALAAQGPEFRSILKKAGFLTRDSRAKERKKYGQRAARARFQFSKR
jgi:small subunit ribosomal protein S9